MKKLKNRKINKWEQFLDYLKNVRDYPEFYTFTRNLNLRKNFWPTFIKIFLVKIGFLLLFLACLVNPTNILTVALIGFTFVVVNTTIWTFIRLLLKDQNARNYVATTVIKKIDHQHERYEKCKKNLIKKEPIKINLDSLDDLALYTKIADIYQYLDPHNSDYELIRVNMIYLSKLRNFLKTSLDPKINYLIFAEIDKIKELLIDINAKYEKKKALSRERIGLFQERN